MHDSFLAFCKWLESTWWGTDVRSSLWAYPFMQLIHFTGLSIWLGTTAAVDMRLLGVGKQRQTAAPERSGRLHPEARKSNHRFATSRG